MKFYISYLSWKNNRHLVTILFQTKLCLKAERRILMKITDLLEEKSIKLNAVANSKQEALNQIINLIDKTESKLLTGKTKFNHINNQTKC